MVKPRYWIKLSDFVFGFSRNDYDKVHANVIKMSAGEMKFSSIVLYAFVVVLVENISVDSMQHISMGSYFQEVNQDFSKISWAHAVNSRIELNMALEGDVMMLECDISLGDVLGSNSQHKKPVMAHPPDTVSDISFEDWLHVVIKAKKRKGIKLDFKSIEVLEPSLNLLETYRYKINFPVWINADIIPGPVAATAVPVDAAKFLRLCKQYFPQSVVSPGWTTSNDAYTAEAARRYSWTQVLQMALALRREKIRQPITFPVRAAFLHASIEQLQWLTQVVSDSTITVWSGRSDSVDVSNLLNFSRHFAADQVYYDLPSQLNESFHREKDEAGNDSSLYPIDATCDGAPLVNFLLTDHDRRNLETGDCVSHADITPSNGFYEIDNGDSAGGDCVLSGSKTIVLLGNSQASFSLRPSTAKRSLIMSGTISFLKDSPIASNDAEFSTIEFGNCHDAKGDRLTINQEGKILQSADGVEKQQKLDQPFRFRIETGGVSAPGDIIITLLPGLASTLDDNEDACEFLLKEILGSATNGVFTISSRGSVPKVLSDLEYPCYAPLTASGTTSNFHQYSSGSLFFVGILYLLLQLG